ncbi:hypothetical protein HMPREF1544_03790 [Mucor circinelloides 1006PhL]|uniref:N-acetyltransferase domain-containing protein n=1 Tax=Mucor circinelloides f. circinelloides (strain 1006PhL) TaxID=1220926 RepID=S2JGL2_MUCC1|nr:hypothetical protein HMPREF1544_03790 [Mucor circinelloides 1006PhL]KAG1101139.1 hypothetical protein G6F42_017551 [Rhizopus arrhizus]
MSEIQVTQIDANYAQTLSALGRRLFADTFSSDNTPENIEAYLDESYKPEIQEKELNDPTMYTYMAFDENKLPVGFAQLRQNEKVYDFVGDPEAIELQRIYVDKNCAGKGIGSKLMAACLSKAKELNKKTMWLGVWEFNPNAIKFYTNKGFKKVGSHVFKMGEQEDTDYIMILKL